MIIDAMVVRTGSCDLFAQIEGEGEEARVCYCNAKKFSKGDRVRITCARIQAGDPLHIHANHIQKICSPRLVPPFFPGFGIPEQNP